MIKYYRSEETIEFLSILYFLEVDNVIEIWIGQENKIIVEISIMSI